LAILAGFKRCNCLGCQVGLTFVFGLAFVVALVLSFPVGIVQKASPNKCHQHGQSSAVLELRIPFGHYTQSSAATACAVMAGVMCRKNNLKFSLI